MEICRLQGDVESDGPAITQSSGQGGPPAVQAAAGFPVYARAHRSLFVGVLSRGTRLPADVIPKIVDYWAHVGWYAIEKDEREYIYSDSELDD